MSNKIVPQIYRQIIDDVLASVRVDFEEYGMEDDVLQTLQAKWEAKLLETRVADFNVAPNASNADSPEPGSSRAAGNPSPPLPLPPAAAAGPSSRPYHNYQPGQGVGNGLALPGGSQGGQGRGMNGAAYQAAQAQGQDMRVKLEPEDVLRMRGGAPAADDLESVKSDVKPEPNAAGLLPGDEIIDSDLDDSDDNLNDDADEEGEGEVDIVFCTYDKVQRVKNKWKTTFKDGMVHINGRDYLFAKCTGEFEW